MPNSSIRLAAARIPRMSVLSVIIAPVSYALPALIMLLPALSPFI